MGGMGFAIHMLCPRNTEPLTATTCMVFTFNNTLNGFLMVYINFCTLLIYQLRTDIMCFKSILFITTLIIFANLVNLLCGGMKKTGTVLYVLYCAF